MTKVRWLLGGIFWVLVSTQACVPVGDSPTAARLNKEGLLYLRQGKYAEAEPLFKRSLAIREKALGPEHPIVAESLENYAALLRKTNREAEATRMEARAKAIRAVHFQVNPAK